MSTLPSTNDRLDARTQATSVQRGWPWPAQARTLGRADTLDHRAQRAARGDHQPQRQHDEAGRDERGGDRVGDGEREQPGGGDILAGRDEDVAERFGTGVDERARAGLSGMRDERRAAAEQEARDLPAGVAAIDDRQAEQRAAERADEAVDRVPRAIDPGDLVGEEFGEGAERGGGEDPIVGEHVERGELLGQRDPAELHRDAGDERDEIQPPPGEQAGRGGEGDQFDGGHKRSFGEADAMLAQVRAIGKRRCARDAFVRRCRATRGRSGAWRRGSSGWRRWCCMLTCVSHIAAPRAWVRLFDGVRAQGEAAGLINAAIHLPLGLMIAAFHPVWSWPGVVVTLLGWALVLKGAVHLVFPEPGTADARPRRGRGGRQAPPARRDCLACRSALAIGWIALGGPR